MPIITTHFLLYFSNLEGATLFQSLHRKQKVWGLPFFKVFKSNNKKIPGFFQVYCNFQGLPGLVGTLLFIYSLVIQVMYLFVSFQLHVSQPDTMQRHRVLDLYRLRLVFLSKIKVIIQVRRNAVTLICRLSIPVLWKWKALTPYALQKAATSSW